MTHGRFQPPSRQIVIHGLPAAEALAGAVKEFWVSQAVMATNSALSGPHGLATSLAGGLGEVCAGLVAGLRAGTPREDVIRLAGALRARGTDALVSVGGGSVVEAAKAARLCLTNNITDTDGIDRLRRTTTAASPRPCLIAVPTTLSAAEYTPHAGVTDARTWLREAFHHPDLAPDVVILDPAMTLDTPMALWLGSGLRAVDHAIEGWCSARPAPFGDATALQALRLLSAALPATVRDPADMAARLDCQIGAWLSIQGAAAGVPHGASHVISHALGTVCGVPQGIGSAILLPHVLRHNAPVNAPRQAVLAEAMGRPAVPLATAVAELVAGLGLPGRLRDAGVPEARLSDVAGVALGNPRLAANPRPMDRGAVEALLQAAF